MSTRNILGVLAALGTACGDNGASDKTTDLRACLQIQGNGAPEACAELAPSTDDGVEAVADGGSDAGVPANNLSELDGLPLTAQYVRNDSTAARSDVVNLQGRFEAGVVRFDQEDGLVPGTYTVEVHDLPAEYVSINGLRAQVTVPEGGPAVVIFQIAPATPPVTCDADDPASPCHQCDPNVEDCNGNMITPDCSEPGGSCNPNQCSLLVRTLVGSEGGDPVEGAEVRIQGDGVLDPAITNEDGEVLTENLPCRALTVDVSAPTFGAQSADVDLAATTDATVTFPLQPLATDELVWTEWLPPCDAGDPSLPLHTIPVFLNGMVLSIDDLEWSSLDESLLTVDAGECDGNPDTVSDVCYTCLVGGTGSIRVRAISEDLTADASVEIRTIE